jgi:hypothetical protein
MFEIQPIRESRSTRWKTCPSVSLELL